MMKNTIRRIAPEDFKDIYTRIQADFAFGEYPPYEVLCQHFQNDVQDGLIFQSDGQDSAYAVCASGDKYKYMLISLLAVFNEFRGAGIGTAFLGDICNMYSDKQGIIVEVERPEDADTDEERHKRLKRIEFYKKAGFCMIPDVEYSIWDIPLYLMVFSQKSTRDNINDSIGRVMYEIYFKLMGEKYIHKMKFRKIK